VKVYRVETPQEFEAFWRRTRPHELVAQEIIPAEAAEFVSLGSYADSSSRLRGAFVGRKLEQYPAGFGTGCLVEGVDDAEVVEHGARLLKALRYRGVSEVEYIRDRRDGVLKVIDVNTRVWKWIGLPIGAGIDLPWLAYQDALGQPEDAPTPRLPLRWVYARDYIRLKAEQAGTCDDTGDHLSEDEWRAVVTGRYGPESAIVEAVHDPDDPGPSVRLVKNLFQRDSYYCPC
jgi:D-aspartate ligase